jgi:hypothetical protein
VRTTRTESETPPDSTQPLPISLPRPGEPPEPAADAPAAPIVPGEGGTASEVPTATPTPQPTSRVADRKAQRAARRQRRRLAIVCAVVVAVCLALTILIVDMARTRTTGGQTDLSLSAPPPDTHAVTFSPAPAPALETRDAPASEGGNR